MTNAPIRVVVSGGSIAGLAVGGSVKGERDRRPFYERDVGPMRSTGAGIVVQLDLLQLFDLGTGPCLPMTHGSIRRYWSPGGGNGQVHQMPQQFTSWQAIYQTLRAVFPESLYHIGGAITGAEPTSAGLSISIKGQTLIEADPLIAAEGTQSPARRRLLPEVAARYAGYVAWRGTIAERDLPSGLIAAFDDCFTFSEARSGGHSLAYFIPGDAVETTVGKRRLNWVWYVGADEAERDALFVDNKGRHHRASLPRGATPGLVANALVDRAHHELHPMFAALIAATPDPFLQTIVDLDVPRTVFGRTILIGDAAFVVRPHTAAGAAKAARDAINLANAVGRASGNVDAALAMFGQNELKYGQRLLEYGVVLGGRWAQGQIANSAVQVIVSSNPPSTRSAAPVVADDNGEAT